MIARLAGAAAAGLLLVACGGDDGGRYDAGVRATRDAVQAGDRDAALASLDELSADALRAHAAGDVSEDELEELTALVEQARAQVDDELPEATTTTTTTPPTTTAPTTTPAPVLEDADDDHGEDDDEPGKKGKGRGGDDGGDDDD